MSNNNITSIFEAQQNHKLTQKKTTAAERVVLLRKLQKAIAEIQNELMEALVKDMGRPLFESVILEIGMLNHSIDEHCENLEEWMKSTITPSSISPNATIQIKDEARGTVLIMGPWNVPFLLVMEPLVATIAAGNCAIVKPANNTPTVSGVIAKLIASVFKPEFVTVIQGSVGLTGELLKLPFDHIFFTGSPKVGKIVMKAAADNLTSVTLELGGKNPFIVDKNTSLKKAAFSLAHKGTINAGQICLSPDYILIDKAQEEEFITELKAAINEMYYVDGVYNKEDSTKIINKANHERLKDLLTDAVSKGANVAIGGNYDDSELRFEPTILTNVSKDCDIFNTEVFGPIFPIINYDNLDEVVSIINKKEKALALYMFSDNEENVQKILTETSSGGVTINDAMMHVFESKLPFGGVNSSGMGSYHGVYGFKELTHQKSVLIYPNDVADKTLAPPFKGKLEAMMAGK